MSYTAKDMRAIAQYAEAHQLRLQLSTPATIRFLSRSRQQAVLEVSIITIRKEYERLKKESQ